MEWNLIECGYNAADETINFGTRIIGEGTNLYETTTLASIQHSAEAIISDKVTFNSVVKNNKLYISINRTFIIFSTLECDEVECNIHFDEIIDTFCVLPEIELFFVFLRNGYVYSFNTRDTSVTLFARSLFVNTSLEEPLFINCYPEINNNGVKFWLVTKHSGFFSTLLPDAKHITTEEMACTKPELITNFNHNVTNSVFMYPVLFVCGEKFSTFDIQSQDIVTDNECELKKFFPIEKLLIGLKQNGKLAYICHHSLLFKEVDTESLYKDFTAIPNSNHIIAVTQPTETQNPQIQLINCDRFDIIFSLTLQHNIFLITPESVHDDINYVSEIQQNNIPKELRFMNIYETLPEARLLRLVKRNCFEEAEAFVTAFNLDKNIVRKARAQKIVDKMVCSKEDINDLMNLLTAINDPQFTLECCLDVHSCCERLEDVKRILQFGCRELFDELENNKQTSALYLQVLDCLFRFDTYATLLCNTRKEYNSNDWFEFSKCDLIDQVIYSLKMESSIIYSRLDRKTVETNFECRVVDILKTLDKLPIMDLEPFLHIFIPVSLNLQMSLFPIFINWICTKISYIEKNYAQDFPYNAINFVKSITKILTTVCTTSISNEISKLATITEGLEQIKILKDEFKIIVPLETYLEGPKHFINSLLKLDYNGETKYCNFLHNYLYRFIVDSNLEPDDILFETISNLMQYEEKHLMETIPHLLKCIRSLERKLNAVLQVADIAQLPWSPSFFNILKNCLDYSHPLVSEIKSKIESYQSLLILHKYKISRVRKLEFSVCLQYIIDQNLPTVLEDLKQLCRTVDQVRTAHNLLIKNFLEIGDLDRSIEIFEESTDDIKNYLIEYFTEFTKILINDKFVSSQFQENCVNFLQRISNPLRKCDTEVIKSTYQINKTFKTKIKTFHLKSEINKKLLRNELTSNVIEIYIDEDVNLCFDEFIDTIITLSEYLGVDRDDLFVDICAELQKLTVTQRVAEELCKTITTSKNLCFMAVLLLKPTDAPLQNVTVFGLNDTFLPKCSKVDSNGFMNSYKLAEEIAVKAVLIADHYDFGACYEVLKWIQTACIMIPSNVSSVRKEIDDKFSCDLAPSSSSFNYVENIFNIFADYIRNNNSPNINYLTYFNYDRPLLTEEQLEQQIRFLPQTVLELGTQGQILTAFKLILNLRLSLEYYAKNLNVAFVDNLDNIIIKQCVPQLLQQVVSTRYFDSDLSYELLMLMDKKEVKQYIMQLLAFYRHDVVKFEAVAYLSYRIFLSYKDRTKQKKIYDIILRCEWWKLLKGKCPVSYIDFFKCDPHELVKKLLQFNCLKEDFLEKFSSDFNLDLQTLLIEQVKSILIFWTPKYTVETDLSGTKKLIMENNKDATLQECRQLTNKIENKEHLYRTLHDLWPQINFYYYEVFRTVLYLLNSYTKTAENKKRRELLIFLNDYKRCSKPSAAEKGEWFTAFPEKQDLDPLSEFRLPFTLTFFTTDVWNLIRPEINLQTYKIWFEAVEILNLSKDELCCFAIKQLVASGLLFDDNNKKWAVYPKHKDLFKQIDLCVQEISDLKMATATMYHLVTNTSQGADLVEAATLCHKYALKYKLKYADSAEVQRNFIKVEKQHLSYSAMHILHCNKLNEEPYLKMVCEPNKLIDALYMDERILKRFNTVIPNFPDINRTVDELAQLYQIDIQEKHKGLLDSWLKDSVEVNMNTTAQLIPGFNEPNVTVDVTADNVKRAAYLCSGKNIELWKSYLLKQGLCDTHPESDNYGYRARTLSCFLMITDHQTDVFKLAGISKNEMENLIRKFSLLSDLKYHGYNFDEKSLDTENKKEILNRLSQINCQSNVRIMGNLCITYNIRNLKYWKAIVKSATRLNMIKELEEYIKFLKPLGYCNCMQFYIDAWQKVVDSTADVTTLEGCINTLRFIQRCPVLYSLKFKHLIDKFINIKRLECAAVLLQYLDESERNIFKTVILEKNSDIINTLDDLSQYGIWGINLVKFYLVQSNGYK